MRTAARSLYRCLECRTAQGKAVEQVADINRPVQDCTGDRVGAGAGQVTHVLQVDIVRIDSGIAVDGDILRKGPRFDMDGKIVRDQAVVAHVINRRLNGVAASLVAGGPGVAIQRGKVVRHAAAAEPRVGDGRVHRLLTGVRRDHFAVLIHQHQIVQQIILTVLGVLLRAGKVLRTPAGASL